MQTAAHSSEGMSLSHTGTTSHPHRDSPKKELCEEAAVKTGALTPCLYRPLRCVLSLRSDGSSQTAGSLIKGWGGAGWETGAVSGAVYRCLYGIG